MQVGQALAAFDQVLSASDIGIPLTETPQTAVLANVASFSEGLEVSPSDALTTSRCARPRINGCSCTCRGWQPGCSER